MVQGQYGVLQVSVDTDNGVTDQCDVSRYVPKDNPSAQSFEVDGVRVGMAGSSHNRVQLVDVSLVTAGTIMCEVSHMVSIPPY